MKKMVKKFGQYLTMKKRGNEALIVSVVMIAIAVALVMTYKSGVTKLVSDFISTVTTKIETLMTN